MLVLHQGGWMKPYVIKQQYVWHMLGYPAECVCLLQARGKLRKEVMTETNCSQLLIEGRALKDCVVNGAVTRAVYEVCASEPCLNTNLLLCVFP